MIVKTLFKLTGYYYSSGKFSSQDGGKTWDGPLGYGIDSQDDYCLIMGERVFETEQEVLQAVISRLDAHLQHYREKLKNLEEK